MFTNNTTDVSQGRTTDDGITINTLWGELAYQLGGLEGYNLIKKNDIERISPAANLFRPILEKSAPALILIDELADYCNKASAVMIGKGSLSDQTIGFMQTLTEVVSSVPRNGSCFIGYRSTDTDCLRKSYCPGWNKYQTRRR